MDAIIIFAAIYPVNGKPHAFTSVTGPFADFKVAGRYLTEHGFTEVGTTHYRGPNHLLDEEVFGLGEDKHIEWTATLDLLHSPR